MGPQHRGENSILLGETDVVDHGSPIIGGRSSFTISVWIKNKPYIRVRDTPTGRKTLAIMVEIQLVSTEAQHFGRQETMEEVTAI